MPLDSTTWKVTDRTHAFDPAVEPDVFSLEGLIAWLEKQNPGRTYHWLSFSIGYDGGCLLHRYLTAQGRDATLDYLRIAAAVGDDYILDVVVAQTKPHTYGAALKRARKLLAERNG